MKYIIQYSIFALTIALLAACTDFEEPVFDGISVNHSSISLYSDGGTAGLVINVAGKWDISEKPSWVKVDGVDNHDYRSFQWTLVLSAARNDSYDRSGYLIIQSGANTKAVVITQAGKKGAYVPVTGVGLNKTSLSLMVGETYKLTSTVSPNNASDKSVTWTSSNTSAASVSSYGVITANAVGTTTITVKTDDGEKTATCDVTITPPSINMENGHEWVDLDLPSGLKWATCNIGANAPEEYGDYYAWGETKPYYSSLNPLTWKIGKSAGYNWNSYGWCYGSSYTLTKYNTNSSYGIIVDYKATLDMSEDAARVNWGGKWRMPTQSDFDELINSSNCSINWTSQNGVNGMRITSKKNGTSLFIPAAGYLDDLKFYNTSNHYWSSSLYNDVPYLAIEFYFISDSFHTGNTLRPHGYPVRPVTE